MRNLNQHELSNVSGGETVMVLPVNQDDFNNSPFITGFYDGTNYAIYSMGLATGFVMTPLVVTYRVAKTIVVGVADGVYTVGHGIYSSAFGTDQSLVD